MERTSLASRLMATAAIWALATLLIVGFGIAALARQSTVRQIDAGLDVAIQGLIANLDTDEEGALILPQPPNDPRYQRALSGWYWQIVDAADPAQPRTLFQSRSLWDSKLQPPEGFTYEAIVGAPKVIARGEGVGPAGDELREAARVLRLPDRQEPLVLIAAIDQRPAFKELERFTNVLIISLIALGVMLVLAVMLQVRIGLAPLRKLSDDVAEVRRGGRARLEGNYPEEVAPLAAELNALLDHNVEVVERARTHVGNLAHALKTPISVLRNESQAASGALADLVARQTEVMSRNVDHHLKRASSAARAAGIGQSAPARAVLQDLERTLNRIYGREGVTVTLQPGEDSAFRGERQDLEEMAGNLMDNACKYGGGEVAVALTVLPGDRLQITVEDDGHGLSPSARVAALKRGGRLDESTPGSGLGLAIVDDLAQAYGGVLTLDESALGGLKAVLKLPATH
ncbi:MAG: ATP-binding protein [Caulobacterales bacterium]